MLISTNKKKSIYLLEEVAILNFVIMSKVVSHFKYILFMLLDRVFGPTTTTRHVYDIAAQHVVSGAMEGVNGKQNRYIGLVIFCSKVQFVLIV